MVERVFFFFFFFGLLLLKIEKRKKRAYSAPIYESQLSIHTYNQMNCHSSIYGLKGFVINIKEKMAILILVQKMLYHVVPTAFCSLSNVKSDTKYFIHVNVLIINLLILCSKSWYWRELLIKWLCTLLFWICMVTKKNKGEEGNYSEIAYQMIKRIVVLHWPVLLLFTVHHAHVVTLWLVAEKINAQMKMKMKMEGVFWFHMP